MYVGCRLLLGAELRVKTEPVKAVHGATGVKGAAHGDDELRPGFGDVVDVDDGTGTWWLAIVVGVRELAGKLKVWCVPAVVESFSGLFVAVICAA